MVDAASNLYVWVIIGVLCLIVLILIVSYHDLIFSCTCCISQTMQRNESTIMFDGCEVIQYNTKRVKCFCFKKTLTCKNPSCTVCLLDFVSGEDVMLCPCGHGYHRNCIKEWIRRKNTCPLCKDHISKRWQNERAPLLYT